MPVNCLIEPRSNRLLRPARESRIEELKLAMKANPSVDATPIVGLVILDEGTYLIMSELKPGSQYIAICRDSM